MSSCIPVASVLILFALRLQELRTKRAIIPGSIRETLTLRLFLATGTVMLVCIIVEFLVQGAVWHWITFVAGWSCAIASFLLRRRAIAALGPYWSLHVEIRDQHAFIQTGPFRWMRHPTYTSMILELVAGALILNAFVSLLIIPLLFIPVLIYRMKAEEAALVEKFGEAYRQYQMSTPALIPYKWPRAS
jgi:protein-S-isoprenylcysteine O-methyltransferase Ste14